MTTTTSSRRAAAPIRGGYGFRTVARMEWHKLRTVRSTWWILAVFAVSLIGLAVLPLLFVSPSLQDSSQNFLPHPMANAMTAVKPLAHTLSPWLLFALLCLYAALTLAAGAWSLTRRDA